MRDHSSFQDNWVQVDDPEETHDHASDPSFAPTLQIIRASQQD